ncbi:MAG: ABC transporter ATP-binding protein [Eggerthia catenaformis]|uniref:ABC transporter ATP-binding protein n=2 Tax=Eggerthia catenaformis TaxID=31973 RepID=UPI000478A605|nr:ABC transporter ATP-binding protein [Eggerthia catenaformis]
MMIYKKLKEYAPEKMMNAYIAIILVLFASLCSVLSYYYVYHFIREIVIVGNSDNLLSIALRIILLLVVNTITYFLSVYFTHDLAFRLETNLKKEGIKQLMNASFSFYDQNESGRIRKVIDDNTALTHMSIAHLIPDLSAAVFIPFFGTILNFYIDYRLGILFLFSIVFGLYLIKRMMGEEIFMSQYMKALEKMNAGAVEYVRGIPVLKIFKTNITALKDFYKSVTDYSDLALKYSMSCRTWYVFFQVLFNSIFIFIIIAFFFISMDSKVFLSKFLFYVVFNGVIFAAFMKIMYVFMYSFQSSSAIEKIENLIKEMKKNQLKSGTVTQIEKPSIEFRDVSFGYGDHLVIENLSFELQPGKTYALVGSSGSGKTTIAKLISGFYPLNNGDILIGGLPITSYTQETLASYIANVFQDTKLFKTTIYENVRIGNKQASHKQIMEALEYAQCDDVLNKFETRENTIIGAKGVHLSGGEVQRISIARAILKNAPIIIMDEASAAADPENEYELQKALSHLIKDKTVIMIAHRLSSIKNVDEVLVVEGGKIVERGNHNKLMNMNGRYRELQDMYRVSNEWRIK